MPTKNQAIRVLKQYITAENHKRSTWYSDIYRATISIFSPNASETELFDLHYFRIPFLPEKERAVKERFHLTDAQLPSFYNDLLACIKTEMQVSRYIRKSAEESDDKGISMLPDSCMDIRYAIGTNSDDGKVREIFFLTKPCITLQEAGIITPDSGILLSDFLKISVRIYQTIRKMNDIGVHLGAIDFDDIVIYEEKDEAGQSKNYYVLSNLLYADMPDHEYLQHRPVFFPKNTWPGICVNGSPPTLESDIFALSSLIWTVTDERCWDSEPNFESRPSHLPDALVQTVWDGFKMNEEFAPQLNRLLNKYLTGIKKGKNNNFSFLIPSLTAPHHTAPDKTEPDDTERVKQTDTADAATDTEQPTTETKEIAQMKENTNHTAPAEPRSNATENTHADEKATAENPKNQERKDTTNKDAASQDTASQDTASKDNKDKDTESKDAEQEEQDSGKGNEPSKKSSIIPGKLRSLFSGSRKVDAQEAADAILEPPGIPDTSDGTKRRTEPPTPSCEAPEPITHETIETHSEPPTPSCEVLEPIPVSDTEESVKHHKEAPTPSCEVLEPTAEDAEHCGEDSEPVFESSADLGRDEKIAEPPSSLPILSPPNESEPCVQEAISAQENEEITEKEEDSESNEETAYAMKNEKEEEREPADEKETYEEKEKEFDSATSQITENSEADLLIKMQNDTIETPNDAIGTMNTSKPAKPAPSFNTPIPSHPVLSAALLESKQKTPAANVEKTEDRVNKVNKRENTVKIVNEVNESGKKKEQPTQNEITQEKRYIKKEEAPWLCHRCNTVSRSFFCPICHNSRVDNAREMFGTKTSESKPKETYPVSLNDMVTKMIQKKQEELGQEETRKRQEAKKAVKNGKNPFAFVSDGPTQITIPEIKDTDEEIKKKEKEEKAKRKKKEEGKRDPFAFINDEVFFSFNDITLS